MFLWTECKSSVFWWTQDGVARSTEAQRCRLELVCMFDLHSKVMTILLAIIEQVSTDWWQSEQLCPPTCWTTDSEGEVQHTKCGVALPFLLSRPECKGLSSNGMCSLISLFDTPVYGLWYNIQLPGFKWKLREWIVLALAPTKLYSARYRSSTVNSNLLSVWYKLQVFGLPQTRTRNATRVLNMTS